MSLGSNPTGRGCGQRRHIMSIYEQTPVIGMRKERENEFINPRTFWLLTLRGSECTYELRIKHQHPEDTFTFIECNEIGDEIELITPNERDVQQDAIAEDETVTCKRHAAMSEAETDAEIAKLIELLEGESPDARCRVMSAYESQVLTHLRRHWDAFLVLFNPAINSF